jgi:hypothetical protein
VRSLAYLLLPVVATMTLAGCHAGEGAACKAAGTGQCASGLVCESPEESSWAYCGAVPAVPSCPPGTVHDVCGQCFKACKSDAECGSGKACNGTYCVSPRTCVPKDRPAPE